MKKKVIVFLSLLCLMLVGVGGIAVKAYDFTKINYETSSKFINSHQTTDTSVSSRPHYATIISRNNDHNFRYKEITAQTYKTTNGLVSGTTFQGENYNTGNNYQIDVTLYPQSDTNNYLAIGAMGNSPTEASGIQEWVLTLTKKNATDYFIPGSYYYDYL